MEKEKFYIDKTYSILDAMERLNEGGVRVLFIVEEGILKASLTDGDLRRAILRGMELQTLVEEVANYQPIFLYESEKHNSTQVLKKHGIYAVPIVDEYGRILEICTEQTQCKIKKNENIDIPIVMMAGGEGTRLYPYTKILPKPLIPVADIPISERIIQSFFVKGCKRFYMIVNYKKNMIKAYFSDIMKEYVVEFVEEAKPLGTGGGLSLLRKRITETFVLTNCDILILDDIREIVEHHKKNKNHITMVCSLKNYQIPYGVVKFSEGGVIEGFEEKPQMSFFTNTGYYILEPEVFKYIYDEEYIGMPDIIIRMKEDGLKVGIYPIGENSWLDMGQIDTLEGMERRIKDLEFEY